MAEVVYLLCAATNLFCVAMLYRSYRASGRRLLLWGAVCFAGLALNSIALFLDLVVLPELDLRLVRTALAFGSLLVLVIGLVWESR